MPLALFPARTIVRDPHHRKFPTRREQHQNLSSGLVEWSCAVVITTTPQQIYRRTLMPKYDFKKLFCNFIEITLRHWYSPVNLLHIFRTPFSKNTSGVLLLLLTYEISGNQSLNVKKLELCLKNSVNLTEKHHY